MERKKTVPVVFCRDGVQTHCSDWVVVEHTLELYVNRSFQATLSCLPDNLENLALGYALSSGLATPAEVISVTVDASGGRADIRLHGGGAPRPPQPLPDARYTLEEVAANARLLLRRSALFRETGAVHVAMLCNGGEELAFAEDIGRHNAIDKCIGQAARAGADLSRAALYTSGRLLAEIARKAIYCGIPLAVSRSAPTDAALALAAAHNLRVIGFAREGRMNLYSD